MKYESMTRGACYLWNFLCTFSGTWTGRHCKYIRGAINNKQLLISGHTAYVKSAKPRPFIINWIFLFSSITTFYLLFPVKHSLLHGRSFKLSRTTKCFVPTKPPRLVCQFDICVKCDLWCLLYSWSKWPCPISGKWWVLFLSAVQFLYYNSNVVATM